VPARDKEGREAHFAALLGISRVLLRYAYEVS
jgi:hypothetical protein